MRVICRGLLFLGSATFLIGCAGPPKPDLDLRGIIARLEEQFYYEAEGGENLRQISLRLYGSEEKTELLVSKNSGLNSSQSLERGKKIFIPFEDLAPKFDELAFSFLERYRHQLAGQVRKSNFESRLNIEKSLQAQRGQTLKQVARKVYGNEKMWAKLFLLNDHLEKAILSDDLKFKQDIALSYWVEEPMPVLRLAKSEASLNNKLSSKTMSQSSTQLGGSQNELSVAKGETLEKISRRLYGTARYWPELYQINQGVLTNPHRLQIGQVLKFLPTVAIHLTDKITARHRRMVRAIPILKATVIRKESSQLRQALAEWRGERADIVLQVTQVQGGESLCKISQRLYGTSDLWKELYLLNADKLKNPHFIKPGTTIQFYGAKSNERVPAQE